MMTRILGLFLCFLTISAWGQDDVYRAMTSEWDKPSKTAYLQALKGYDWYCNLKQVRNKRILTIIDYSLPSFTERLWVIDLNMNKVIHQSLVAHGRSSGEVLTHHFSNDPNSYSSSLGFFLTAFKDSTDGFMKELYLIGLEPGINDNALKRKFRFYGSPEVSSDFIDRNNCVGRTEGAPAVQMNKVNGIVESAVGNSIVFIYHPTPEYYKHSRHFEF